MNKTLVIGFKGNKNSSKVLLDNINPNIKKIYLDNDFDKCKKQLLDELKTNNYDYIYAFGQKPLIKSIYIELNGKGEYLYKTEYDVSKLNDYLKQYYKVKISHNAGNYLCNHIYYEGLKYIKDNSINSKMIFIHIPYLQNIDIIKLSNIINQFIK